MSAPSYVAPTSEWQNRVLRWRSSDLFILTTVCTATFTDGFVYSVIVPVLPYALEDQYHVPPGQVQFWTSTLLAIFGGIILVGSPILGVVADHTKSRKPPLYFGFTSLLIAVILLAVGDNIEWLIVSRVLQGLSAAVTFTVGLALVADTVDPKDIGRCMGFALSSMSFGVLVGPLLGGIVFAKAGYYAVIAVMAGLVLVDICLPFGFVEKRVAKKRLEAIANKVDERTTLLPKTPVAPRHAPSHQIKPQKQNKRSNHMKTLLKSPQILAALWGVAVQVTIVASFDAVLTVFLEDTFGWSSLDVGLAFLALALPVTILGPVAGTISDHIGPRWPAVMGCLLTAPPLVLMQLITHPGASQTAALIVQLILIGSSLAFIVSPLAADLFFGVEQLNAHNPSGGSAVYAQSYALFTCALAAGNTGGPIIAGVVKERFGWTVMTWSLAAISISGAVPAFFYTSRKVVVERKEGMPVGEIGHHQRA